MKDWNAYQCHALLEVIPALYHVRFRACQIGGPLTRFPEALLINGLGSLVLCFDITLR
jgi:hypothetical protein